MLAPFFFRRSRTIALHDSDATPFPNLALMKLSARYKYGGTRHTTTTAWAIEVGEAGAKEATGHDTNKAFHRYCQAQEIRALEMAKVVRGLHHRRTTKSSTTNRVK